MVSLTDVQASNKRVSHDLPPGLVAVFVGATAGIGESSLREFARCAISPRIHFVGRSKEAGERLLTELKSLNQDGEYFFIQADTSLLKNVDEVCEKIRAVEDHINILFQSQGTIKYGVDTAEGLPLTVAVGFYGRMRFIVNLLPLLQRAPSLRRVVSVLAATKEGPIDANDFQCRQMSMSAMRGHGASMMTMTMAAIARTAPTVTFIHTFPGFVKTNLVRPGDPFPLQVLKYVFLVLLLFHNTPIEEVGQRHAYYCTSNTFPPKEETTNAPTAKSQAPGSVEIARGADGQRGSGVYSVDAVGEGPSTKVTNLVLSMQAEGMVDKAWNHTLEEFVRICGSEHL